MTHQDALTTNELIGTLTEAISIMEHQENWLYRFVENADDCERSYLKTQIENANELIAGHSKRFQSIVEAKAAGNLRFLDEKPFHLAILRLKAAVLLAETTCNETVTRPD